MRKLQTLLVSFSVLALGAGAAQAQELLTNVDLEVAAGPPLDWSLSETVTGMPGTIVNSADQVGFANQPMSIAGEFGLWLRSFQGNIAGLMNQKINAVLSQTAPGAAGETYTFTGWSKWEQNYSGGVTDLDPLSPSGEVPSPTNTTMELAFLDNSNAVIDPPVTFDLRTPVAMGGQQNDNMWRQHTLMGLAPAGTANVRVTATATDMVFNVDPQQSAFYDNFSLTAASAPATEKLSNAGLNQKPPENLGFTLTETPMGTNTASVNVEGFANHTPGGAAGLWLQAFATQTPEGDAVLSQTVPAVVGGEYTYSAWSKWETGYSGGVARDGAPDTETTMELAFLDGSAAVIGTPLMLDLRTVQMSDNMWRQFTLMDTAPAGTASVRISAGATDMFDTTPSHFPNGTSQSAFFDDFSLMIGLPGDHNGDGQVNLADYVWWRKFDGTQPGYDAWFNNFGSPGSGSGSLSGAVPEPACCMLAVIAVLGGIGFRRCRRTAR